MSLARGRRFRRAGMILPALLVAAVLTGCSSGPGSTPPPTTGAVATTAVGSQLPATDAPPAATFATSPVSSVPAQTGRPSSPAILSIVSPTNDQVVTGSSLHVVISLQNAVIVQATTTNLNPGQGHIHLYVDGSLVSMNYSLEQDLPLTPGTYQLKAEFVAADHAPFNPRVWSQVVVVTVH